MGGGQKGGLGVINSLRTGVSWGRAGIELGNKKKNRGRRQWEGGGLNPKVGESMEGVYRGGWWGRSITKRSGGGEKCQERGGWLRSERNKKVGLKKNDWEIENAPKLKKGEGGKRQEIKSKGLVFSD